MISSGMAVYTAFAQLRAWAAQREHWPALCEAIAHHIVADEAVYDVLPQLQAEPELAALLLSAVSEWQASSLRTWLARRLLAPDPTTVAAFCALASERARRHDPGFPAADASRLVITSHWFAGERWTSDQRQDGIGWVLHIEDRDIGPAEAIHEDEWTAVAHGAGWALRVHRLAAGSLATKCYEEDLEDRSACL
jgi:hypothetical protein